MSNEKETNLNAFFADETAIILREKIRSAYIICVVLLMSKGKISNEEAATAFHSFESQTPFLNKIISEITYNRDDEGELICNDDVFWFLMSLAIEIIERLRGNIFLNTNVLLYEFGLDCYQLGDAMNRLTEFATIPQMELVRSILSQAGKKGAAKTNAKTSRQAQADYEKIIKSARARLEMIPKYKTKDLINDVISDTKTKGKKPFSKSKIETAFRDYGKLSKLRNDARK